MTAADLLLVSEIFPPTVGGSGELLCNVYGRLDGVSVTVFCDGPAETDTRLPASCLRVVRRPMRSAEWGVLHPAGLRHHLREARRVRSFGRPGRVVVHCARALPEGVGAVIARRTGGPPFACWAHGEDIASARSSREQTWLMRQVFRRAAALFANSRNTAGLIASVEAHAPPVEVVYPGVDPHRFRPDAAGARALREKLAPGGEILLLAVGRLQRRKGHDHTLQALARIGDETPRFRLAIVGDGDERPRLESLARELGLSARVTFEGSVAADALPAYYAAADIFVHPNRIDDGDLEGFGMVFLEAAAAGLAVIGGASGGVPEAVVDRVTGLLVSGTDVNELKAAILTLARAPERRREMGVAGRARAVREFTWARAARQVRDVHERVAAAHGGSRRR